MQQEGEAVDEFIADLYRLVEHCKYGDLQDELVRDRIVVGLRDSELSEKLQLTSGLTLEAAVTQARQSESVKTQQKVVRDEVNVDQLHSRPGASVSRRCSKPATSKRRKPSGTPKQPLSSQHCGRCGKAPPHHRDKCPAKDVICHKCSLKGHYARYCKTKRKIDEITLEPGETTDTSSTETVEFLDSVDAVASGTPWLINVQLNNRDLEFKVDTGADVTVLPEENYQPGRDGVLETTTRKLSGPVGNELKVLGKISGYIKCGGEHTTRPLMGKPAIEALQVVTLNIQSITSENVRQKFPKLFNGLGKLDGAYTIKLREDATPYALTTPRRVAVPLMPKVKQELERMQSLGVITEITEATEWCAGMVVVPKANGQVRICVDLTKLNENVCRERHILPSVEQVLAQIGDAKYFSKLDANSGFWQIELDEQSSKLTTFITPFGRFCFNRLPFGIMSAPEHFQRCMLKLLQGIEGVVVLVDDTDHRQDKGRA